MLLQMMAHLNLSIIFHKVFMSFSSEYFLQHKKDQQNWSFSILGFSFSFALYQHFIGFGTKEVADIGI